jgi:hypothetical protein
MTCSTFGKVDSDGRQRVVHRPLHFGLGVCHVRRDTIQERREVESGPDSSRPARHRSSTWAVRATETPLDEMRRDTDLPAASPAVE